MYLTCTMRYANRWRGFRTNNSSVCVCNSECTCSSISNPFQWRSQNMKEGGACTGAKRPRKFSAGSHTHYLKHVIGLFVVINNAVQKWSVCQNGMQIICPTHRTSTVGACKSSPTHTLLATASCLLNCDL